MENRSRLAHAPIIAWLLALLLNWHSHCLAGQSTPPPGNESLTLKANDPTASLTQFEVKDEYTPSEFGTNAQPNTLTLRGILAVYPRGPLNLEQLIRPTFQIETKPLVRVQRPAPDSVTSNCSISLLCRGRIRARRDFVGASVPISFFPPRAGMARAKAPGNWDLHGPSHIDAFRIWLSRLCFSRPPHLHTPRPSAHRLAHSHLNRLSRMNFPTSGTWPPMRQPGPGTSGTTLQPAFRSARGWAKFSDFRTAWRSKPRLPASGCCIGSSIRRKSSSP